MSRLTKLEQIKETKKNFFKSNYLLEKRASTIIIKIKNLISKKDLKIGLPSRGQFTIASFKKPGILN